MWKWLLGCFLCFLLMFSTGLSPAETLNTDLPGNSLWKVTFLVPLHSNEGHSFSPKTFQWLEANLLKMAGGYTQQGIAEGQYLTPQGKSYRDQSKVYFVVTQDVEKMKTFLSIVAQRFSQESLYCEVSKPDVFFILPHTP